MLNNAAFLTDVNGRVPARLYDCEYRSDTRGLERGELRSAGHTAPSRFQWGRPTGRKVTVTDETLNTLRLALESGGAADLIRTDSYYPGWRAFSGPVELAVQFEPPCFSRLHIPAQTTEIRLTYEPRHWRAGLWIAGLASVLFSLWLAATFQRGQRA
jgi:hypothetical protein